MEAQKKPGPIARMYGNAWGRAVLAAAVAAVLLCACSAVQTVSYLTNDDNAIAYTLAGYHTGEPSPYALFINCLLGFPVSALYTAAPGVPWWAALQLAAIALSTVVIGACMLCMGWRRAVPLWLSLAVFAALTVLLLLQPVVELTYTVTAAVLGSAGCALILCAAEETGRTKRTVLDALGCSFVVGAFLYREETGFALLSFLFAACGYRALLAVRKGAAQENAPETQGPGAEVQAGKKAGSRTGALLRLERPKAAPDTMQNETVWRRGAARACLLFLATLGACLAAFALNNALQEAHHGMEYWEFFRYRERFTDYPRDSYSENPALYEGVGWDETLYGLADRWCFMDARINTASLKAIAESTSAHGATLARAAADCLAVIDGALPLRMTTFFLLCAGTVALCAWWRDRRRWPETAALLCVLLGSALLCLLLGLGGRFLERTFRVVAIPACVLAALLAMRLYAPRAPRRDRAGFVVFAAAAAVLALTAGVLQARELRVNSPKYLLAESRAVTAYALAHPQNVYFRDTYVVTDVDATTTYPMEKPVNLISWGGCEMHSATARKQLAANGLSTGYADVFREEAVFFITRADSAEYAAMERYLLKNRHGARLEQVDVVLDGIAVYKAVFPGSDAAVADAQPD